MNANPKAHLGKLYHPLEKLGENITLDLELHDANDQWVETFSSSHAINDGLSLLFDSINQKFSRNWQIPLGNTGSQKKSFFQSCLRFFKALDRKEKVKEKVKAKAKKPTNLQPSKFAEKRRLKIESDLLLQIELFCNLNKVSVNSFLATAVFKSYSHTFDSKSSRWMIPVNIRDRAEQQVAPGMHSSYFLTTYQADNSIQEVHHQMKFQLQSGSHWANYYLGSLLVRLPDSLIDWLTRRDFHRNTSDIAGSFSNLGTWKNLEKEIAGYSWSMFPTVRAHRPFGITVNQWGESLTFALRLHHSVEQAEAKATLFCEELMKNIKEMSRS